MTVPTFRNLVFEGGGVWGIAYEGALAELESSQILPGIQRVAGASAGAICAALLAVGYSPKQLGHLLRTTNFKTFQDDSFGYGRDVARLLRDYGWYKGEEFLKWMQRALRDQVVKLSAEYGVTVPSASLTFTQLREWQEAISEKGRALPRLYLVGTNLSKQRREVYSHQETPLLPVADSVRRSMSIPLFFACARGQKDDIIVDGGLTWNYPVDLFDSLEFVKRKHAETISYATNDEHVFNPQTLGFRVDTTKELEFNLKDRANEPVDVKNIVGYGWALVTFMRALANKAHLHKNDWARTIFIDVGEKIVFTDFDLTEKQQDFLSDRGREGVKKFLQWRSSPTRVQEVDEIYLGMK